VRTVLEASFPVLKARRSPALCVTRCCAQQFWTVLPRLFSLHVQHRTERCEPVSPAQQVQADAELNPDGGAIGGAGVATVQPQPAPTVTILRDVRGWLVQ